MGKKLLISLLIMETFDIYLENLKIHLQKKRENIQGKKLKQIDRPKMHKHRHHLSILTFLETHNFLQKKSILLTCAKMSVISQNDGRL